MHVNAPLFEVTGSGEDGGERVKNFAGVFVYTLGVPSVVRARARVVRVQFFVLHFCEYVFLVGVLWLPFLCFPIPVQYFVGTSGPRIMRGRVSLLFLVAPHPPFLLGAGAVPAPFQPARHRLVVDTRRCVSGALVSLPSPFRLVSATVLQQINLYFEGEVHTSVVELYFEQEVHKGCLPCELGRILG